jgi:hypothetical protein
LGFSFPGIFSVYERFSDAYVGLTERGVLVCPIFVLFSEVTHEMTVETNIFEWPKKISMLEKRLAAI